MTLTNPACHAILAAGLALALLSPGTARAEDPLVANRLKERGMKFEVDADGDYKVTYNYSKEGRTQLVFVAGRTETVGGLTIREVYSPAARVEKDRIDGARAIDLLQQSGRNKLGSWEMRGDVIYFVIKVFDSMTAAQLEAAMDVAAETADNMELEISGARDDL